MSLENPWLLALLSAVPLAVWMTRGSVARLSTPRLVLAALVRALALSALVLALAGFAVGQDARPATIFVVDSSDSVLLAERANAMEVIDAYVQAVGADTPVGVVQFGAGAAVLAAPQRLRQAPALRGELPGHASDYDAGVLAALGLLDPEVGGQLVLMSDGAGAEARLRSIVHTAAARGVPISVLPIDAARSADLVVEALEVPASVQAHSPALARVHVTSQRRTTARLRLWDGARLVSDGPIDVTIGARVYRAALPALAPGFHRLRAELLEDADPRLTNNVAEAFVQVAAPGRALVVGGGAAVPQALRSAEFQVRQIEPAALAATDLSAFDVVFVSNVEADVLGGAALEALRAHVAGGRGLVVLGGASSFAAGGYQGTPLDEALPVWSDPTQETPEPRLALALVIDRSTSMAQGASTGNAKIDLALEAAADAAALLDQGDILGVMAFDLDAQWVVPPRPLESAADVADVVARIRGIRIGTSTDLYRAMFFARARLDQIDASIKHVVLLTDGRVNFGDFDALTRSMRRRDITVSAIAIGEDADRELLERVARLGNGRYYYVADPRGIPRVLTQETRTASEFAVVEREFQPQLDSPSPIFAGELAGRELPTLQGFVRTRAKPTAEVILRSDDNDPILAQWQYGRGRAVAWTSDASPAWADAWLAWDGFETFVRQTAAWVSPAAGALGGAPRVTAARTAAGASVEIDAVDAAGRFLNGLDVSLAVIAPNGARQTLPAAQVGPGRYAADLPNLPPGVYQIEADLRGGDGAGRAASTGLVIPAADEQRSAAPDHRALRRIADATGGVTIASSADLAALAGRGEPSWRFGWPQLLTLALLAFVADVGVRRLIGGPGEIRARAADRGRAARARAGAARRALVGALVGALRRSRRPFARRA